MNLYEQIVDEWFNRLEKGYAIEPYTPSELRVLNNVIKEKSQLIEQELFVEKVKGPNATQWEHLIVIAFNGGPKNAKTEYETVKQFWKRQDIQNIATKIADDMIAKNIVPKNTKLVQVGSSNGSLTTEWKEWGGSNTTPKTDVQTADGSIRISLKQSPKSQLLSSAAGETNATFQSAMAYMGENYSEQFAPIVDTIVSQMGKLTMNGTVATWRKIAATGKTETGEDISIEQKDVVEEFKRLDVLQKELTKTANDTLFNDEKFKAAFCHEAATGTSKFSSESSIANVLVEFDTKGKVKSHRNIKSIDDVNDLASNNTFYVSFKGGGKNSKIYLSMRSRKTPKWMLKLINKKNESLKIPTLATIINEELGSINLGKEILIENKIEKLNEYELFDKFVSRLKGATSKVKASIKKVVTKIMDRIKDALNAIMSLGKRIWNTLLDFIGFEVESVDITSTGEFPLV